MSRLAVLRRHPKRTIGGLTVALAAIGVAVGSGASFTSSSAENTNVFTAGTLTHTATNQAVAVLTDIKPGYGTTDGTAVDTATTSDGYGKLTLANSGSLDGHFTVTANPSGAAMGGLPVAQTAAQRLICGGGLTPTDCLPLHEALQVQVNLEGESTPLYDGAVSGLSSDDLGDTSTDEFDLAADGERVYEFHFYFPDGTPTHDNAYQGGTATVGIQFAETQATP